ncbi:trypsin-like peptidase domain-containing protein [Botrimarina hoheduenensis]|uniref:Putative serine protease HtrA n=1 Tax=Botrimarina hoheduenensis TaxID=2528000 RepID=A0A5C5WDQ7_9BACT|nr:trypsin-like peptidase domain-containing protein [Botrimarina hoheduenensis]TWT48770.1 putative serine protease HtrA [Botrimarina hoheduenensis]
MEDAAAKLALNQLGLVPSASNHQVSVAASHDGAAAVRGRVAAKRCQSAVRSHGAAAAAVQVALVGALSLAWMSQAVAQAADAPSAKAAVLAALQDELIQTIAATERSVVAITRYPQQRPRPGLAAQLNAIGPALADRQDPFADLRLIGSIAAIGHGAGVVIGPDLVLTQYQAIGVSDAHTITTVEGQVLPAMVIGADPRSSLAVLRVEPERGQRFELPALPLGQAEKLRKGRFVIAIGNPFSIASDGQPTASWGIIANTARRAPAGEDLLADDTEELDTPRTTLSHFGALIQTDAQLGWNAAGGALVTFEGELVGILTTTSMIAGHEQPAGYAIPLNKPLRRTVQLLSEGKEPEYGLLGIRFGIDPRALTKDRGVTVSEVYGPGPAGRSGLLNGDIVTSVGGKPVTDAYSLQLAVAAFGPGEDVVVKYLRGPQQSQTTVRLGKAYVEGPKIVTSQRPQWQGLRVDYPTAVPAATLSDRVLNGHLDPEGCVVVSEVEPGSVSWSLGVRPYVYISHVDGNRVSTPDEFYQAVNAAPKTARLKFTKPLPSPAQGPGLNGL